MKATLSLWSILLSAFATISLAKVNVNAHNNTKTYEFEIDDLQFQNIELNGQTFVKPQLKGVDGYLGIHYEVGTPALPVIRFYIHGTKNISVSWAEKHLIQMLNLPTKVVPTQPSAVKIPNAVQAFSINHGAYSKDQFSFTSAYKIEEAGSVRGATRFLVTLYPVSYKPNSNEIRFINRFAVKTVNEQNPFAQSNEPEMIAFVVAKEFEQSPALAQYLQYKQSLGFQTKTLIYGKDVNSIEEIRKALQDILKVQENNLKYAVIIGDSRFIPAHDARHMYGITDHYYRAIDTNDYETDLNGPDIAVGRMSVETEQQLQTVVDKYIAYQSNGFTETEWLSQISWIGSNDGSYWQVAEGTHNYVIDAFTKPMGYHGNFPSANNAGGDQLYPRTHSASATNIETNMKAGRVFVVYSGHGSQSGWEQFSASKIAGFTQPDFMPFVLGFACNTGDYRGNNGIAETFQRSRNGAILYFGSVDSSYWDEDDILERRLFDGIFKVGLRNVGPILDNGLSELWKHYAGSEMTKYYWESYTTFSDPSIVIKGVQ